MMCSPPRPDPPTPTARYVQPGDLRSRTQRPRRQMLEQTHAEVDAADDDLSLFALLHLDRSDVVDLVVALLILAAIASILVVIGGSNV